MLTPAACEEELRRLSKKLEERTDALAGLLVNAATTDVDYRVEHAKALLRSVCPTDKQREADATEQTAELLRTRKVSEAHADACREAVRSLRDQLSACQSANANVRFQAGLS